MTTLPRKGCQYMVRSKRHPEDLSKIKIGTSNRCLTSEVDGDRDGNYIRYYSQERTFVIDFV